MALYVVQNSTINLRIHHSLFNRSCNTTSPPSVKMHSSSASAARLCSGLRTSYCLAPPPPCSILRSARKHRQYSNVSLSDAASDEDFYTFEKFTEKAINVVTLAKVEAKRSGYYLFGAEHVLLAIISEGTSIAADILTESMQLDNVEDARKEVKTFTKQGSRFDANRVFKLSIDNARKLGHDYVDVEHILLGLIPEDESNGTVVLDILKMFGVDPASTRKQLLQRMDQEKMSMLEKYGTNLTKVAKNGTEAGRVIEHTKEAAEQVINTLCSSESKNPCLIGESRVANTEIVREIAQQIACGKAPKEISGKQVIMLHVDRLVNSCEAILNDLVREIKVHSGEILLFIDDIESLLRRMSEYMSVDVDLFESGELQSIITASTKQKYEKNKFMTTLFLPVEVPEPSITESIFILRNSVSDKMRIADEALLASAYLSQKYDKTSRDSFLDEVFDLIDDANSLVKWYKRQEVSEVDIRTVVSLRYGVPVEEIAAMKDIVVDATLTDELSDKFWDENSTCAYFTERLRDRLAHSYNPTDFLEGKTRSPIDSKAVCDLLANIEDEEVVVDFDSADSSFVVHRLVKARYASDDSLQQFHASGKCQDV